MAANAPDLVEMRRQAFGVLLDQCLKASQDDNLLVVYDESFLPYEEGLLQALRQRALIATQVLIPQSVQQSLADQASPGTDVTDPVLPAGLSAALSSCSVVLNALGGGGRTLGVRKAVLNHPRPARSRLAHMPGLTDDVLAILAVSPVDEIVRTSEIVAWALGEASQAELVTPGPNGRKCRLDIKLDRWDNEPFMSPGVIFPGSWGNVPPGETFCCPNPLGVNGSVCVNGSVPGAKLDPGDEVVLTFENGTLIRWEGQDCSPAYRFFERENDRASHSGDLDWDVFAELGIGLNPAVTKLTGNPLFDEKAIDTVHVAIGDNTVFGHNVRAQHHSDLVCRHPTLSLDGIKLLQQGRVNTLPFESTRERLVTVADELPTGASVFIREARVQQNGDQLLRRLIRASRIGLVRMAGSDIGCQLGELRKELDSYGQVPWEDFVSRHPAFGDYESNTLLNILYHYRALGIGSI